MNESCLKKQTDLKILFEPLSRTERYEKIIELGKSLPTFPTAERIPENLVHGCQSLMYLTCTFQNDILYLNADSDALISKGLAALLLHIYNNESPQTILTCPPTVIKELGLTALISPGRANGLAALYTRILKEVIGLDRNDKQRK